MCCCHGGGTTYGLFPSWGSLAEKKEKDDDDVLSPYTSENSSLSIISFCLLIFLKNIFLIN